MKKSLLEIAQENGIDINEISRNVNIIYALSDVQESYFIGIEQKMNKIGHRMPKFKQEVYELKKAIRALVGTVNKVCKDETVEHFANDSDELYNVIDSFCKNKL